MTLTLDEILEREAMTLTLDEILDKKTELENRLVELIAPALKQFKIDTGFCVSEIDIGFIDVTAYSEKRKTFVVGRVSCKLGI